MQKAKAFKDADFRLASVGQATVAGIDVTQIHRPSDLSTLDRAHLAAAYATGSLPLRRRVNLEQLVLAPVTLESNLCEATGQRAAESLADLVLGPVNRDQQLVPLTLRLRPTLLPTTAVVSHPPTT